MLNKIKKSWQKSKGADKSRQMLRQVNISILGAFPPVAVNSNVMKTGHKAVEVETIGTMGGLHHPTKKLEYEANGAHLYVKKGGGMKAGDSGGPWVMHANGGSYLVGVLHGGGIAGQTSHIRSFLDTHIEDINWAQP